MGRTVRYTIALEYGAYNFSRSDWARFTAQLEAVLGRTVTIRSRSVRAGDFEFRRTGEIDPDDADEIERIAAKRKELKGKGQGERRAELKRRINLLQKTLSKSAKPTEAVTARVILLIAERTLPGLVIDSKKGSRWTEAKTVVARATAAASKRRRDESSSDDESDGGLPKRGRYTAVDPRVTAIKQLQSFTRRRRFRKEMSRRQKERVARRIQAFVRGVATRRVHRVERRERATSPERHNDFDDTPFPTLCKMFELIKLKRTKDQKLGVVFNPAARRMVLAGNSLYPVLRLMLPQSDSERASYGVKEARLGRIYCKMLGIDKRVPDCDWIMNWADPKRAREGTPAGDFSVVLEKIMEHRASIVREAPGHTVQEVNQILDEFAAARSDDDKASVLLRFNMKANPRENAYLARIILKDMHIGITEETVLKYYHPDAYELYLATDSLKEVLDDRTLLNPRKRVDVNVELFRPFRPMLAQRHVFTHGEDIMGEAPFYIEDKLDGERLILHKKGRSVRTWSRRGIEKPLYNELLKRATRFLDAGELILDGELLSFDDDTGKFLSFGTNLATAKIQQANPNSKQHLKFMVFDVLLVNGQKLKTTPLSVRKTVLNRVVVNNPLITKVPYKTVRVEGNERRYAVIDAEFKKARAHRKEGLILKKSDSPYVIGQRSENWIKMKADYSDGHDTFDMIILGGYYGEGRRRAGDASSFLVGVPNPKRRGYYLAVGKVGTGYGLRELADLQTDLRRLWVDSGDKTRMPEYMRGWEATKADIPNVWVSDPSNSVVLEIKSAELTKTDQYSAGYTFRNPRVVRIRRDKGVRDIWTLADVERYYTAHGRDIDKEEQEEKRRREAAKVWDRLADDTEAIGGAGGPKPKRKGRQKKVIEVMGGIRKPGEYDVEVVGNSFEGKKVYVDLNVPKRKEVELFIHSQGGKTTASYHKSARYFVGTSIYGKARNASIHSLLLKPSWVDKIKAAGTWIEPEDDDYLWKAPA